MRVAVTVYGKQFLEQNDSWSAQPTTGLLQYIHQHAQQDSQRWIAVLKDETGKEYRIALGDPVKGENQWSKSLFLPTWFVDQMGMSGTGEEMTIELERSETIAPATRLRFRILGDIVEGMDMVALLEEPLSQLGVIEEGQMLPVPVLEGCVMVLEEMEPAMPYVFLHGNDVALEIDSEVVAPVAAAAAAAAVPQPSAPPVEEAAGHAQAQAPDQPFNMLPSTFPLTPNAFHPPSADLEQAFAAIRARHQQRQTVSGICPSFTPFSGTGHRLGRT